MTKLLNFDKPAKVEIDAGFEDGPTGGYVPQMGKADAERWKAKKFNIGKDNARIELRKSFGGINNDQGKTQVTIFVALDGWDYSDKNEYRTSDMSVGKWGYHTNTKGLNVRISMNGPLLMKFAAFKEINDIVFEAEQYMKDALKNE